ncbi:MAG: ABC transporter ATP-binding protein [Spirochaetales bacterium]|uniref:ABC transporter ATP-binding protein n=1 Tax=Candidatus Thalassospirochaeta sargassi TaxID=3119039 RepID=A0AAJ1IH69_9SPIO|nr:ABC transporter ATP-binding protein [Spirochaetales bacterium]
MAQNDPILKIDSLSVSYGHVKALSDISLEVGKGEIVVLVGANGAGKTSIMETVLGANVPVGGDIEFKGIHIGGVPVDKNVRNGMFLVPEGRGVFASMTVMDNLLLGAHHNLKNSDKKLQLVFDSFPVLGERKLQVAGTLSGGERQMLAIARALMSSPDMIMVDEPSIGLAPIIVNDIFEILVNLNKEGYSILLSEQNVYKALKIAHRGYVLETGRIIKSGTAEELLNDEAVREAYLGA